MNEREERLERMLDAALAEYGAAEPLAGLEERVLGRLGDENPARPWWMWGAVAAAAAVMLVALLLMLRSEPRSAPVVSKNPPGAVPAPAPVPQPTPQLAKAPKAQPRPRVVYTVAQDLPKRDVFPTPEPPSEQELLLAKYLRRTPREEVLTMATRPQMELPKDPWEAPVNQPGGGGSPIQQFGR